MPAASFSSTARSAKELGVPLITNEGYRGSHVEQSGIRARASKLGVAVFAPHEFYEGKLDEEAACAAFGARFQEAATKRIDTGPPYVRELLQYVSGYYRHVLFGETAGRSALATVRTRPRP